MTPQELISKQTEIEELTKKIDIRVNSPIPPEKAQLMKRLINEMESELWKRDCDYAEVKLAYCKKIHAELREVKQIIKP